MKLKINDMKVLNFLFWGWFFSTAIGIFKTPFSLYIPLGQHFLIALVFVCLKVVVPTLYKDGLRM